MSSQSFQISSKVIMETFEQGALVLRLEDQHLIELNSIAATILEKTNGRQTINQIATALAKKCNISEAKARRDTIDFSRQMIAKGIIKPVFCRGKGIGEAPVSSKNKEFLIHNPSAVLHADGEGGLLCNPENDRVKVINGAGVQCWKLCDGMHDLKAITDELQKTMEDAPIDTVFSDIREFLEDLLANDFLQIKAMTHEDA